VLDEAVEGVANKGVTREKSLDMCCTTDHHIGSIQIEPTPGQKVNLILREREMNNKFYRN